jgi:sulfite oxidase
MASVVQCAGNRRSDMTKIKAVNGLNWRAAAIGNAEWSGATLNDVLLRAGIDIDKVDCKHVQFEGLDKGPEGSTYGASIPIDLARQLKNEILVAYEMNGQDIPADHGFPVRIIIPGIVGARMVKWLHKIILSDKESDCHWQQRDYKGFHSSIDWHNVDFTSVPAIMELPVQSAICEPQTGSELEAGSGEVTLQGYAWSGGGRGIVRVDVSTDGGKTWHSAELQPTNQPLYKTFAWTLWEATVPLPSDREEGGKVELVCKAVDASYNVQPDSVEGIWNLRGVLSNAWHRVHVTVPKE